MTKIAYVVCDDPLCDRKHEVGEPFSGGWVSFTVDCGNGRCVQRHLCPAHSAYLLTVLRDKSDASPPVKS